MDHTAQSGDPAPPAAPAPAPTALVSRQRTATGARWFGQSAALAQALASIVVIAIFVITFLVQAFQIPSSSMERTLLVGDYLLVERAEDAAGTVTVPFMPRWDVKRGDIVVFRFPLDPNQYFVKRVIGVPGDRVRMRDGQVFVNGRLLRENYTQRLALDRDPFRDDFPQLDFWNGAADDHWRAQLPTLVRDHELVVPRDRFFVLGDNRDQSLDSRYWGFVPRANLVGRPLLIYWSMRPWTRASTLAAAHDGPDDRLSSSENRFHVRWDRILRQVE